MNRVNGEFEAKEQRMIDYLKEVKTLQAQFEILDILQISQGSNSYIDFLITLALSMSNSLPKIIMVEFLLFPSTNRPKEASVLSIHLSPN